MIAPWNMNIQQNQNNNTNTITGKKISSYVLSLEPFWWALKIKENFLKDQKQVLFYICIRKQ